jgi:hypothetical protein
MDIVKLQDKLLAWYAQGHTDEETYQFLGFAEWSDYHAVYNDVWTPEFRYRLYLLHNPCSTMEQAFVRGIQVGWMDGFDVGYDSALEDLDGGVSV